jgi:peptidoglycan/xylan/chitin deacetylase (PgdA/CDA1 family)
MRKRGIILSYHRIAPPEFDPWGLRVDPSMFDEQMSILSELGEPMRLEDFAAAGQSKSSDRPAIVVTFDDGYVDNLLEALPCLRRHQIPATAFISTGFTDRPHFWWEVMEHVFLRPGRLPPRLTLRHAEDVFTWDLGAATVYTQEQYEADCIACKWRGLPGTRVRLYFDVYDALWTIPSEPRVSLIYEILRWSGIDEGRLLGARPMTRQELHMFASDPLITIGGHSVHHLPLDTVGVEVQEMEIAGGQSDLENWLGCGVDTFAYPHGKFTPDSIRLLETHGFICACTTREAAVDAQSSQFELPRVVVKNWNREIFKARVQKWLGS